MQKKPNLIAQLNTIKTKTATFFKNKLYRQIFLSSVAVVLSVILIFAATAAWYNNVLRASGLNFKASEWGFEGNVLIDESVIKAYPGSSGIIPLSVENTTEQIISVTVDISKTPMSEDFRQRMYFYADTQAVLNGETVDRVYINSFSSYSYTLLPGQPLSLSEGLSNNTEIKWEWVYDVLGYYFSGTVTSAEKTVSEYLSPVIYDYDKATFDDGGNLLSVDSDTPLSDFLYNISSTDGYEGIVSENSAVNGCFPVSVDENGKGVWLYLCSYGEIEAANAKDTELGSSENSEFSAALNVVGQQRKFETVTVSNVSEFVSSLSDPEVEMVALSSDVSLSSTVTVPTGTEKIIDLGGHKITVDTAGDMFRAENSSLYLMNGTVEGGVSSSNFVCSVTGSDVTVDNVTVTGLYGGINIRDSGSGKDSSVHISNSSITAGTAPVLVFGNGDESSGKTVLTVDSSELTSTDYIAIAGNGTVRYSGTDIRIKNSRISGLWAGIFQPQQNSSLTVENSEISGFTGIAVKGGSVKISDSKVSGTDTSGGKVKPSAPAFSNSGFTDTGDGVYAETNYNYSIDISITGDKTEISGFSGYAVRVHDAKATSCSVSVTGGKFSSDVSAFVPSTHKTTQNGSVFTVTAN